MGYTLKDKYKGVTVTKTGRSIILDNVKSSEVELLGVEYFFNKTKKKKDDKKDNKDDKE